MLHLVLIASLCVYEAAGDCASQWTYSDCMAESGCSFKTSNGLCMSEGNRNCCYDSTSSPTKEPTPEPTPAPTDDPTPAPTDNPSKDPTPTPTDAPTCPTNLGSCEAYDYYASCCPSDCIAKKTSLCLKEGAEGCCLPTPNPTPSPTPRPTPIPTPSPTPSPTGSPTTPEPTIPECPSYDLDSCEEYTGYCCPEVGCATVTTGKCKYEDYFNTKTCCTSEPTPEPTPIPTPKPTEEEETPKPTEEEETPKPTTSTTTTTEESSEETTKNSWPTPKPTMPSAEKWEMIHPAYNGGDGELLWHVYYGDFSNDDRFDSFRKTEQWDTKEIKPIIMHDKQFKKYRNADSKKFNAQSAVITDNNAASGAQSYGSWLIGISAVLIVLFAVWYKFGSMNKKSEYTPLLTEEKVQYDQ